MPLPAHGDRTAVHLNAVILSDSGCKKKDEINAPLSSRTTQLVGCQSACLGCAADLHFTAECRQSDATGAGVLLPSGSDVPAAPLSSEGRRREQVRRGSELHRRSANQGAGCDAPAHLG